MFSQWDEQPDLRQRKKDRQRKWRLSQNQTGRRLTTARPQRSSSRNIKRRWKKKSNEINQQVQKKERGRDRETSFKQTTSSPKRQYMSFLSAVSVLFPLNKYVELILYC